MKAIRINQYGGPEVLKLEDAPQPVPAPDEILIRVVATSINPIDCKIRAGYMTKTPPLALPRHAWMGCVRPPITTMFNWRVDVARTLLFVDKKPVADAYWGGQVDLWVRFVLLNPTQPFVPPASNTGNCQFRFGVEVPDQQNRIFTIDDANWIKAYNSVSGDGNGWYVQWAGAGWQYNLTNSENFDYVQHVCAAVQAQP